MKKLIFIIMLMNFAFLQGQNIKDYLKEAENNNRALLAKYREYEAALKQAPQVSAIPDATLSFGYFVSQPETRVGPQNFKLSLVQKLPWFGRLSSYEKESLELAEAKWKDYENLKDEIFYKIRTKFYELYELEKELEFEKQSIDLFKYLETIVQTKLETSKADLSDLLRLQLVIYDLETRIELLEINMSPIKSDLRSLLNRSSSDNISVPEKIEEDIDVEQLRDELANSPAVEKLKLLKKASEYKLESAESESMPDITLGLDYINVRQRNDMAIVDNGKDIIMPMVGISIPFFNSKYSAKEEQAKIQMEQYEYEQENLLNELNSVYDRILTNIEDAEKKFALYKKQIERSENIRELLIDEYSVAEEDIEEIIRIEESIIDYKIKMLEAENSKLNNKAKLIRITGE